MNELVRLGSYPIIFGITAFAQLLLIEAGISHWPYAILVAGAGMSAVAILERVLPYEPSWNLDHEDTLPDILHATFSLGFIFASVEIAEIIRVLVPFSKVWPNTLPLWAQVFVAGLIIDFGLCEPPRVLRRLRYLRQWSHHEQNPNQIYPRSARASSSHDARSPQRISIALVSH